MAKRLLGSFYPKCSSKQRVYAKGQYSDGIFEISNGNLVFTVTFLIMIKLKRSVVISLRDIEKVEAMNLNGFMPFGVCLFMKDGKEYMFGHINNRKLKRFIEEAMLLN